MEAHRHDSTRTSHYIWSAQQRQIGSAFILLSHVEATRAAGGARRDMREFYSEWARVLEGIELNPTCYSVTVCCLLGGNFSFCAGVNRVGAGHSPEDVKRHSGGSLGSGVGVKSLCCVQGRSCPDVNITSLLRFRWCPPVPLKCQHISKVLGGMHFFHSQWEPPVHQPSVVAGTL